MEQYRNKMRKKLFYALILLVCFTAIDSFAVVNPKMAYYHSTLQSLKKTRDSLASILPKVHDKTARLNILYDLSDISLSLKDYSYTQKLWEEGVKYQDEYAMMDAGEAFVLKNLNDGKFDVADHWLNLCKKHLIGKTREPKLAFMELMRNIRDLEARPDMIQKLIDNQIELKNQPDKPYENMKLLYELAAIAIRDAELNKKLKMKSWDSYMRDGLLIAEKLPFVESYSFRHQFLKALCFIDVKYTQQLVNAIDRYRQEPFMKDRKYFTHIGEILAYSQMLSSAQTLDRRTLDNYFNLFNELTAKYPYDCPSNYEFYYYDNARFYYGAIGQKQTTLDCIDSVLVACKKYKFDSSYYYDVKGKLLAEMGRWEEAYKNNLTLMSIKDSISAANSGDKLMELQTQYDVDHLKYQNQNKLNWIIFISILVVLMAVLIFYLFRYNKIVRRRNVELVEKIRKREYEEETSRETKERIPEEQLSREEKLFNSIETLLSKQDVLQEKLGRDELAQMLNTNRTYVTEAVKVGMDGMSVSEYINQVRLKRALKLLQGNPEISVAEIGEICGFSSKANFYRVFGKMYEITPGDYRNVLNSEKKGK